MPSLMKVVGKEGKRLETMATKLTSNEAKLDATYSTGIIHSVRLFVSTFEQPILLEGQPCSNSERTDIKGYSEFLRSI